MLDKLQPFTEKCEEFKVYIVSMESSFDVLYFEVSAHASEYSTTLNTQSNASTSENLSERKLPLRYIQLH